MSASGAGAMMAWMGGVIIGVGISDQTTSIAIVGAVTTAFAIIYVRRFAESD